MLLTLLLRLHISGFEAEALAASNLNPKRDCTRPESLLTQRCHSAIIVFVGKRGRGRAWGRALNDQSSKGDDFVGEPGQRAWWQDVGE